MAFGGELRANTPVVVMVGPFVDETDGKTAETGLTITQAEVRLSKNGGNMAQKNEATALSHDELGDYTCNLDATDTNTEGILRLRIHESGALPIAMDYSVLSAAAWDSKYLAKDAGFMDVNIKTVGRSDTQETEANNLESACSNYSAERGLTGTALPAAAADAAGGVPVSDAGGLDIDTKLANTNEVTAARMGALTDLINGGRLDLLIDAIKAKTDNLPTDPADASVIAGLIAGLNNIDAAAVITALKASTGWTAGGTYSLATLLKIMAAIACGKWQLKSGETNIYEVLDSEDQATVIGEITLSETSPYQQFTKS